MYKNETLGLVLGSGDLAKTCVNLLLSRGFKLQIIKLPCSEINVDNNLKHWDLKYEKIDELFLELKEKSINKVAMVGYAVRPRLNLKNFNLDTLNIIEQIIPNLSKGDSSLFIAIKNMFENQGLSILKIHELLIDLTLPKGNYGVNVNQTLMEEEINKCFSLFKKYSILDLGQSLVFHKGQCLGIETLLGTDQMLNGLIDYRKSTATKNEDLKVGGFLLKAPKLGQILEIDLPAIGPNTINLMQKAKLSGLVLQSNQVLIMNKEEVIDTIKRNKMFMIVKDLLSN